MIKPKMWLLNGSYTNRTVQAQRVARVLDLESKNGTIRVAKTKVLISRSLLENDSSTYI